MVQRIFSFQIVWRFKLNYILFSPGFARMASESRHDVPPIQWVLPPGLSARALGGVFYLDYVCR